MEQQDFVQAFLNDQKRLTTTGKVKVETYISPASLLERRFYWEGTLEDDTTIKVVVPLPKVFISDVFSFLFLAAFNLIFSEELATESGKEMVSENKEVFDKFLENEIEKEQYKKKGIMIMEYVFYVLFEQDNLIEILDELSDPKEILDKIEYKKVHKLVKDNLPDLQLDYIDQIYNLIPVALDLYLYINTYKKPKIKPIDEQGVNERAQTISRLL